MAWFEGTHAQSLIVDAPLAAAKAHFANLAAIAANTSDLERFDIDGDVLHLVMKAQDHAGIAKFQGDYRSRYTTSGDTVRWEAVSGNTKQSGEARFTRLSDNRTTLDYTETVAIDMDVPAMMAPMLRPLITQILAHEIKGFVGRMVKAVPAA
jgi:hypothetical protein